MAIKVIIGNNLNRHPVIIPETMSLREAMENEGVDYTIGTTALDGCTLNPGDLDKTFLDFGVTEKCYLINVVKADNAASIQVIGNTAYVVSDFTTEQLEKIQKYREKKLHLYEKEDSYFVVNIVNSDHSSINQFGACFGNEQNAQGKALIAVEIPPEIANKKDWVKNNIGTAILDLNKVEAQLSETLAEIDTEMAAVEANITVM